MQIPEARQSNIHIFPHCMRCINFTPRWRTQTLHRIITGSQQQSSHYIDRDMYPRVSLVYRATVSGIYRSDPHPALRFCSCPYRKDQIDQKDSPRARCTKKDSPAPSTVFRRYSRRALVRSFVGNVRGITPRSKEEAKESMEAILHCGLGFAGECTECC